MKKGFLYFLPLFVLALFVLPKMNAFAAGDMEIAEDANFENQTTQFSANQTIYVRVSANSPGETKHLLNLRDNQYNLLETYDLGRVGDNQFTVNFSAPTFEGYYSLEALIESPGANAAKVKTIKIGSPQNASVKVNVQSQVSGQSVTRQDSSPQPSSPALETPTASAWSSPSQESGQEQELLQNPDFTFDKTLTFSFQVGQFFKKIWTVIWPF